MIAHAVICAVTCAVAWTVILGTMWRVNPAFRGLVKGTMKKQIMYALAVFGLFAFVSVLASSCRPYADAQAAEPAECSDGALAAIVAECQIKIRATSNVTEKNRLRAACLERVDMWETCR